MLTTIVVPLDGSDFAAAALPIAVGLASASGARVEVVGVARDDTELDWTYEHVHESARRVPSTKDSDVEIVVDPDPAGVLLGRTDNAGTVLCFASHDRMPVAAKVMHSVGSELIKRAKDPFLVVGARVADASLGMEPDAHDVVVALDGVHDPQPLLTTAITWADLLHARLRIVTVYEPVLPDLRRPSHFTRGHGPSTDPDEYLDAIARDVQQRHTPVSTMSIADPVSAAGGLEQHLESHPANVLVVGGPRKGAHVGAGTVRELLRGAAVPLLVVNHHAEDDAKE
jgi:nucleotide-binding universal stress UspA family protein